ncbi:dienelactone hydrolase family protein [Marinobacterium lutimaris]|uniref:Dienelactone hydrolase n=1 Tax=Marinobacterium lutimaris TaxID=568106 RepID=A0A1H6C104_9GAMM|nr:dienelactone hydrolase family protein [Marinobacterium lutimaris]SEG66066.1 Dienelactone hydrolase [Marinobacterium lutimaris]
MRTSISRTVHTGLHSHEFFATDGKTRTLALIFPTWAGISAFERAVAKRLNGMGLDAVIVDYHGSRTDLTSMEGRQEAMQNLVADFEALRQHLQTLKSEIERELGAYENKLSLGYCLGGLCTLQLGLIDSELRASISFHGLLSFPKDLPALTSGCRFLILNGSADPMVTRQEIAETLDYFDQNQLDMSFISFSGTAHSFAIPGSNNPAAGVSYSPLADRRSWRLATDLIAEVSEANKASEGKDA